MRSSCRLLLRMTWRSAVVLASGGSPPCFSTRPLANQAGPRAVPRGQARNVPPVAGHRRWDGRGAGGRWRRLVCQRPRASLSALGPQKAPPGSRMRRHRGKGAKWPMKAPFVSFLASRA